MSKVTTFEATFRERRVEQRAIRREHRAQHHGHAQNQRRPAPRTERDQPRFPGRTANHRETASAQDLALGARPRDGEYNSGAQQRPRGSGTSADTETGSRSWCDGVNRPGRAKIAGEQIMSPACRNAIQGAGQQRRQRQRDGDAPRRRQRAPAEDRRRVFQIARNAVQRRWRPTRTHRAACSRRSRTLGR